MHAGYLALALLFFRERGSLRGTTDMAPHSPEVAGNAGGIAGSGVRVCARVRICMHVLALACSAVDCGGLSVDCGGLPSDCGGLPSDCGGLPSDCGGLPSDCGGLPSDRGGLPVEVAPSPPDPSTVPPVQLCPTLSNSLQPMSNFCPNLSNPCLISVKLSPISV